jgi:hypothetical protein
MTTSEPIDIRDIIERIGKLTKKEKVHILNILKPHDSGYTQNANGYFFNLGNVSEDVVKKLLRCLQLIEKNRNILQEMDTRRDSLVKYYKGLIEDKLKTSREKYKNDYVEKILLRPSKSSLTMKISRKKLIRRRNEVSEADIDELIKEHLRGRKYEKDTVYHRLNARIRTIKSGRQLITKRKDEDTEDGKEVQTEVEEHSENIAENENEGSEELMSNDDEIISNNDSISSNEDGDKDVTEEIEETEEDCFTDKFSFYKRLLNTKGFKFDDNKHCFLVTEEYIE